MLHKIVGYVDWNGDIVIHSELLNDEEVDWMTD